MITPMYSVMSRKSFLVIFFNPFKFHFRSPGTAKSIPLLIIELRLSYALQLDGASYPVFSGKVCIPDKIHARFIYPTFLYDGIDVDRDVYITHFSTSIIECDCTVCTGNGGRKAYSSYGVIFIIVVYVRYSWMECLVVVVSQGDVIKIDRVFNPLHIL